MRILFKLNPYLQQRQQEKPRWIFPIKLAMYATYLRNQGHQIVWDKVYTGFYDKVINRENQIDIPFLQLPHADRILTDAFNPKWQRNGNFKYLPGTYIQSAEGCVWGKCSFCVEKGKPYEVRPVEDVISEIEEIKSQGFKEVFDDSATFPFIGGTNQERTSLQSFCDKLGKLQTIFSCNMRLGIDVDFVLLKKSGFRMLLFGVESANQKTLDKIGKGVRFVDIKYIIKAADAGLEPHIAVMFGYPWETDQDALHTLKLVWWLLKKGYAKTAQASFYNPPDHKNNEEHRKYVNRIYEIWKSPQFWFNKIKDIKNIDDLKYLWRGIKVALNG